MIEPLSAKLTIIYEPGDDGCCIGTIPEVPGAFSRGKTKEEARENVLDAFQELLLARRDLALEERLRTSSFESVVFRA